MPDQRRKVEWVRGLAELRPDLVVDTGDNSPTPIRSTSSSRRWSRCFDVPGVFVMGSNDYWAPTFKNPLRYVIHGGYAALLRWRPPAADGTG